MNYVKSLKKIVSLVTLLTFIFTNTGYSSPLGPKDTLRVPMAAKNKAHRLENTIAIQHYDLSQVLSSNK